MKKKKPQIFKCFPKGFYTKITKTKKESISIYLYSSEVLPKFSVPKSYGAGCPLFSPLLGLWLMEAWEMTSAPGLKTKLLPNPRACILTPQAFLLPDRKQPSCSFQYVLAFGIWSSRPLEDSTLLRALLSVWEHWFWPRLGFHVLPK